LKTVKETISYFLKDEKKAKGEYGSIATDKKIGDLKLTKKMAKTFRRMSKDEARHAKYLDDMQKKLK